MKFITTILLFVCITCNLFAQVTKTSTLNYDVSTPNFDQAKKELDAYIAGHKLTIVTVKASKDYAQYILSVNPEELFMVDTLMKQMGYISSKDFESSQVTDMLAQAKLELSYLEAKKSDYQKMQNKIDSVNSNRYYDHWNKSREIDEDIYKTQKKIQELNANNSKSLLKIRLNDDASTPTTTKVSFVNMPGVQYNYLIIENPQAGTSYHAYQGATLKYMFTKGKSYFEVGAYKAIKSDEEQKDTSAYDELFNLSFGQDFYTSHFGRGGRRFLNLYVSYSAGCMFASSAKTNNAIAYLSPGVGLELFKNRYMIIDTKGNYFLPFTDNRVLRGWNLSASFNFVF